MRRYFIFFSPTVYKRQWERSRGKKKGQRSKSKGNARFDAFFLLFKDYSLKSERKKRKGNDPGRTKTKTHLISELYNIYKNFETLTGINTHKHDLNIGDYHFKKLTPFSLSQLCSISLVQFLVVVNSNHHRDKLMLLWIPIKWSDKGKGGTPPIPKVNHT